MKESYSHKEAIEILKRALTVKDQDTDKPYDDLKFEEIESMAGELGISRAELQKAATEVTQTKEHYRDEVFPEVVTARWIPGRLTDQEIEAFLSELRLEYGHIYRWDGKPLGLHKVGKTWEYPLKEATIVLTDMGDGFQLRVTKQQFFHGNNVEAALMALPIAFILGIIPVAAALEWLPIYTGIFVAAVSYITSFYVVKNYTHKKRLQTMSQLLRMTEFAELKLREQIKAKQTASETTQVRGNAASLQSANKSNKLRS